MADSAAVRVALLARPGNARDQLRKALIELGATLVAEGDPSELDPGAVAANSPTLVLVSLEPAIESALDRFDALLATPGVEVMYDDAEVTRDLDGWDLNRWARHLAAKLLGSDVLPPAPGGSESLPPTDLSPTPGLPPTPAQLMDGEKLEDYAQDAPDLADWVPTNPSLTDGQGSALMPSDPAPAIEDSALDIDLGDIEQAMSGSNPHVAEAAEASLDMPGDSAPADEDFTFEFDAAPETSSLGKPADGEPLLADMDFSGEPVRFSNFDDPNAGLTDSLVDDDVAALAAQLDTFERNDSRQDVKDPDFSLDFDTRETAPTRSAAAEAPRATAPATASELAAKMDFSNLSLLDEAADHGIAPSAPATTPSHGIDSLNLELAPMDAGTDYQEFAPGAAIIIAGLGGPDAVRQMLASLPEKMPVPVLLYQHLEVGKHERLAEQLAKISKLPVVLAEDGTFAQPGKVFVLPAGMSAVNQMRTLRFTPGSLATLFDELTPADSLVVMLSGADAALVPAAMKLLGAGGLAMAQEPDSCFDPAAAQDMARLGAPTFLAPGLSQQIAERWPG